MKWGDEARLRADVGGAGKSQPLETWRVQVTLDDVRAAHDAWLLAHDAGAPSDRLRDLREELERIVRTRSVQAPAEA